MDVTGIILAGGKSSRMGTDKATMNFHGLMLVENSIDIIKGFCSQILISSNNETLSHLGYTIVPDEIVEQGPLGGLISCLRYSTNELNIVIACDTPLVDTQVYKQLLGGIGNAYIVMACDDNDRPQPLIACYRKTVLSLLENNLKEGKLSLQQLSKLDTCKLLHFSGTQLSVNINTPNDYKGFKK